MAGVEAGAEFVEEFGFAERPLGMAARAPHLLALDLAPVDELDRHLVPHRGARHRGVVILVDHDPDLGHQLLHLRLPDKGVGVFAEAGAPRDDRHRHREFHAEFRFEPGLRQVVAQNK